MRHADAIHIEMELTTNRILAEHVDTDDLLALDLYEDDHVWKESIRRKNIYLMRMYRERGVELLEKELTLQDKKIAVYLSQDSHIIVYDSKMLLIHYANYYGGEQGKRIRKRIRKNLPFDPYSLIS